MKFELVDKEQFIKDFIDSYKYYNLDITLNKDVNCNNKDFRLQVYATNIYQELKLPKRATIGSAGYDFFFPVQLEIPEGLTVRIPTGVKWNPKGAEFDNLALFIFPRSSLGITYALREPNLVTIIDSDYYDCKQNTGHIFIYLRNDGNNGTCLLRPGTAYSQGVIMPYYITEDDDTTDAEVKA